MSVNAMPAPAMMAREATMTEIFSGLDGASAPPEFNTAETTKADELPEMNPLKETEVIFSANVNNASWSYVRNSVVRGRKIDPSFVRTEEMINSFDYGLTAPEQGELFSVTTKANACPWNAQKELLFVGIKGMEVSEHKPNHLVFLVDVSGSMQSKVLLEQMAIVALISRLGKGDTISIITYSNDTKTVVKNLDCGNMDKCIDAVLSMEFINGCTYGSQGLNDAYEFLAKYPDENTNRRVFILTDGDFNFGITSDGGLETFIKEKKQSGIYLSVVGYGMENFKDNHMETLARNGNGNYCFVGSPYDIVERLAMQFESTVYTIAKNVKIKVEMNPEYVSDYRLIGYHARSLTRQDFDNTEKSVDGIGSGHTVVGLIEFTPKKSEPVAESRYTQTQSKHLTDELGAVTIRYQSPDDENLEMFSPIPADLDKNSHLVEIAGFLASFGLEMSDSDYKGTLDKSALQALIEKYQHDDNLKEYCFIFQKYLEKI